ncbi:MAG: T9SS type A sorting domain-containing protein [Sphingomonadales bacterium]
MRTYPNPTKDNTTLVFELAQSGKAQVEVYSITGRLVWNKTLQLADGTQELSIDSADLPAGTYIVKFNSGKQSDTAKFIKL